MAAFAPTRVVTATLRAETRHGRFRHKQQSSTRVRSIDRATKKTSVEPYSLPLVQVRAYRSPLGATLPGHCMNLRKVVFSSLLAFSVASISEASAKDDIETINDFIAWVCEGKRLPICCSQSLSDRHARKKGLWPRSSDRNRRCCGRPLAESAS